MNKKFVYIILLFCFLALSAFVMLKYNVKLGKKKVVYYTLQERKGSLARLPEWPSLKTTGETLFRKVTENPKDIQSAISLASLYIQEGRITGNHAYYDAAAMKYIDDVLAINDRHFEAHLLKAVIQLSQHHFSDALETAGIAQKINPYNSFVYGIMVDGNVELGNYAEAVMNSDKMISIRPDIRSYSRISYLREIHGDYPGAIEAMKMAVDAGPPGDESTEWARAQLARLYELTGAGREAEMHYTIALNERPGFSPALAGLARLAMDKREFDKSISLFQQADSVTSDYSVKEQMAELYQYRGDEKKADEILEKIINELKSAAENGGNHHADKELANIYLMKKDFSLALKHAGNEYNVRPENTEVNETMAWAHFKNGDAAKALPFIEKALRTNSKNPQLLCRAGAIYAENGNTGKARSLLQEGLKNNPVMDLRLKEDSKKLLTSL